MGICFGHCCTQKDEPHQGASTDWITSYEPLRSSNSHMPLLTWILAGFDELPQPSQLTSQMTVSYDNLSDCDLVVFACKTLENFMLKYLGVDEMEASTLGNIIIDHRSLFTNRHTFIFNYPFLSDHNNGE